MTLDKGNNTVYLLNLSALTVHDTLVQTGLNTSCHNEDSRHILPRGLTADVTWLET